MSPTPVTFTSPTAPAVLQLGGDRRGGRGALRPADRATIVRFDLNTSPAPPALVGGVLAAGRFETPLSEYPPTDYRRLVEAAAARYGVGDRRDPRGCRRGRDPRHRRQGVPPGRRPRGRPDADLRDVPGPDRAARRDGRRRARDSAPTPAGRSTSPAIRAAARGRRGGLAVQPEQPDRAAGARRRDRRAPRGPRRGRRRPPAARPPIVVLDEAYAEFVGSSLVGLRATYPNLIVVRTASKAYALAGLRVGFAMARPEIIARLNPFRPPGSVSTVSVTRRHRGAPRPDRSSTANLERVERRARRGCATRSRGAAGPSGRRVTNFILVDFGSAERRGGRRRGAAAARARATNVRGRPSARRPPALDGPRPATRTTD